MNYTERRLVCQAIDEAYAERCPLSPVAFYCTFAWPGTYGHECGKPATLAASARAQTRTASGLYWSHRCTECAQIPGGENAGLSPFVPFHPGSHRNVWK